MLKVLEELRIPVDCVVGTSMGSIVGGLYASGLSPEEMDAALRAVDWAEAFNDYPARRKIHFRRKQDDLLPLLRLELGVGRGGLKSSAGLISGQTLSFIFRQLTLHTVAIEHFDDLSIPFRAVAADLETGDAVVLEDGSLAEALRASMAVPGIFSPVHRDGRTLVDGGIASNLPLDVGRAMGAERLLAVDIGSPKRSLRDEETPVGVVRQTFSVLNRRERERALASLGSRDLLLTPELGDITSSSFDRVVEAIEAGEKAARSERERLARLSVPEEEYREHLRHRERRRTEGPRDLVVQEIAVGGSERVDERQIRGRMKTRAGSVLDLEVLRADLDRIYQIGEFEQVIFRLEQDRNRTVLAIDTIDKTWGPGYLRSGLAFSANLKGESSFLALANIRRSQLNAFGAEWRTIVQAGDVTSISTELFQPLDYRGFGFLRPYVTGVRDQVLDRADDSGQVDVQAYSLGIDVGVHLQNYAELSLGVETGRVNLAPQQGAELDSDTGALRVRIALDQLDDTHFPREGAFVSVDLAASRADLGADLEFERLEVRGVQAWSRGPDTLLAKVRYGEPLGSELPIYAEFELGGFLNLSGFEAGELRGQVLGLASLSYYRRIGGFYAGAALEAGNVWESTTEADLSDLVTSGALFVGRETLVGPLYLGYGSSDRGTNSVYLFLGQIF